MQKAAKITVFDLEMNPVLPGLRFHRLARRLEFPTVTVIACGDDFQSLQKRYSPRCVLFFAGAIFQQPYVHQTAVHLFEQFVVLGAAEISFGALHLLYARLV